MCVFGDIRPRSGRPRGGRASVGRVLVASLFEALQKKQSFSAPGQSLPDLPSRCGVCEWRAEGF
jgi:hypothetical protein